MILNRFSLPYSVTHISLRRSALALTLVLAAALSGCAGGNLTGLVGAREDFGCPASGGVNCTTVSATYEREHADETQDGKRSLTSVPDQAAQSGSQPTADPRIRVTTEAAEQTPSALLKAPLNSESMRMHSRLPERVVMLWILPWVDEAGDLHSDSRLWMRVRDAAWRIESVRTRAMRTAPQTRP